MDSKTGYVAVQETRLDYGNEVHYPQDPRANVVPPPAAHIGIWLRNYFPWIQDARSANNQSLRQTLRKKASIARNGFLCLLGALLTLLCSFLVLHYIDGKPEKAKKWLQPAAWLSAIIAADTIFLNAALLEGVTIAWWYRATSKNVQPSQLHDTWKMGTNVLSALQSGRNFNYVAMALIFVATVPLNGLLLQNAVSTYSDMFFNKTELHLPLADHLPLGYSASIANGALNAWSPDFIYTMSSWETNTRLSPGNFYTAGSSFDLLGCTNRDNSATCRTNVTIAGFNMTCTTTMDDGYNLNPERHASESPYSVRVFSTEILWNPSMPQAIDLNIMYKPNQTCEGYFEKTSCRLMAAKMQIPIQVSTDQGFYAGTVMDDPAYSWPVASIDSLATSDSFLYKGKLLHYEDEGKMNSTYGGIAQWLSEKFDTSINWTLTNGSWSTSSQGTLAKSYRFMPTFYPQNSTGIPTIVNDTVTHQEQAVGLEFDPEPNNSSWCKNVYVGLDWMTDEGYAGYFDTATNGAYTGLLSNITDTIYTTLNQLMLGASVNEGATQLYNAISDSCDALVADYDDDEGYIEHAKCIDNVTAKFFKDYSLTAEQTQHVLFYRVRYSYYGASVAITVTIALMILPLFYGFWTLDHKMSLSPFETATVFRAPGYEGMGSPREAGVHLQDFGNGPVHTSSSGISPTSPSQLAIVQTSYKPWS